jgi:hypothetical protein
MKGEIKMDITFLFKIGEVIFAVGIVFFAFKAWKKGR